MRAPNKLQTLIAGRRIAAAQAKHVGNLQQLKADRTAFIAGFASADEALATRIAEMCAQHDHNRADALEKFDEGLDAFVRVTGIQATWDDVD